MRESTATGRPVNILPPKYNAAGTHWDPHSNREWQGAGSSHGSTGMNSSNMNNRSTSFNQMNKHHPSNGALDQEAANTATQHSTISSLFTTFDHEAAYPVDAENFPGNNAPSSTCTFLPYRGYETNSTQASRSASTNFSLQSQQQMLHSMQQYGMRDLPFGQRNHFGNPSRKSESSLQLSIPHSPNSLTRFQTRSGEALQRSQKLSDSNLMLLSGSKKVQHEPYVGRTSSSLLPTFSPTAQSPSAISFMEAMSYPKSLMDSSTFIQTGTEEDANVTVAIKQKVRCRTPHANGSSFAASMCSYPAAFANSSHFDSPKNMATPIPVDSMRDSSHMVDHSSRSVSVGRSISPSSGYAVLTDGNRSQSIYPMPSTLPYSAYNNDQASGTSSDVRLLRQQLPPPPPSPQQQQRQRQQCNYLPQWPSENATRYSHFGEFTRHPKHEEEEKEEEKRYKALEDELGKTQQFRHPQEEQLGGERASLSSHRLRIATVKGKYQNRFFATDMASIHVGAFVIVQGDRGEDIGTVVSLDSGEDWVMKNTLAVTEDDVASGLSTTDSASEVTQERREDKSVEMNGMKQIHDPTTLPRVVRLGTDEDRNKLDALRQAEKEILPEVRRIVAYFTSNAKITTEDVEYQFDRQKVTIYVGRPDESAFVDFRRMQRRLYRRLKCRIWIAYMDEVVANEGGDVVHRREKQRQETDDNEKMDSNGVMTKPAAWTLEEEPKEAAVSNRV